MDMSSISKRFTDLRQSYRNKPYERHKDSLEVQLSSFLFSLVPSKKLSAATAEDIVKFLISKDSAGKRKLHLPSCSRKICDCPKRLAAGTVDSYIGKLRSIFNKLGAKGRPTLYHTLPSRNILSLSERSKPSSLCDLVMLSLCSMKNLFF